MDQFLLVAPLALASSELPRLVNFIVFIGVLVYLLRKPAIQFFKDRAEQILQALNHAQTERETARTKLQEIESRLNRLGDEIQELKTNALAEAAAEEKRIKERADADAEKIKLMARREITSSMNAAQIELKAFAAAQAIELAKDLIQREMKEDDHHRLIEQFSRQIEEVRQ